jgi:hypothetical protein
MFRSNQLFAYDGLRSGWEYEDSDKPGGSIGSASDIDKLF